MRPTNTQACRSTYVTPAPEQLWIFADEYFLHWFGFIFTGGKSYQIFLQKRHNTLAEYAPIFNDAHWCLQMGFELHNHQCDNTSFPSPEQSLVRNRYVILFGTIPKVVVGMGAIGACPVVSAPCRWFSGPQDSLGRVWNATTGEWDGILILYGCGHMQYPNGWYSARGTKPEELCLIDSWEAKSGGKSQLCFHQA